MSAPRLEYFYFNACPFCQMVNQAIEKLNVKVEYKNIQEKSEHLDELVKKTGRRTTPCLFIDGEPMHESADIIDWLNSNIERLSKVS